MPTLQCGSSLRAVVGGDGVGEVHGLQDGGPELWHLDRGGDRFRNGVARKLECGQGIDQSPAKLQRHFRAQET